MLCIAATTCAEGSFRQDLYFRLRVVEIRLPPLRDRDVDLVPLADALLARSAEAMGRTGLTLAPDVLPAMRAYDWPGNVRELANALERAVILHDGEGPITADELGLAAPRATEADTSLPEPEGSLDDYFVRFVQAHEGELSETEIAKRLGISRKTLWERRSRLGIPRKR